MEITPKLWGQERLIVNNEDYCGKWLEIKPGFMCSLHYHPIKRETFAVVFGSVELEVGQEPSMILHLDTASEPITIEPNTPHRFWSTHAQGGVILEISTPHTNTDVVRLETSRPLGTS